MRNAVIGVALAILAGTGTSRAAPPPAPGEPCAAGVIDTYARGSGETWYGEYEPTRFESLAALPQDVRSRLDNYLGSRLGEEDLLRLHFDGGRRIDRDALLVVRPDAVNYKWEVPAYELHFRYERADVGIRNFHMDLNLRLDGTPIADLPLPAFATDRARRILIPLVQACQRAAAEGFAVAEVELDYSGETSALFWRFTRVVSRDEYGADLEELELDAHTGATIRRVYNREFR